MSRLVLALGLGTAITSGGGPLTITQGAAITIVEGGTQTFTATGGTLPYTWSTTNHDGSSIDSGSGAFTCGSNGGFQKTETVTVTDGASTAVNITVTTWNPSYLANLLAWWRADLGASQSGGVISQLNDQSGNGHHLTVPNSNPTYNTTDSGLNNQPSVLTASGHSMEVSFSHALPVTAFWVGYTADTSGNYLIGFNSSANFEHDHNGVNARLTNGTTLTSAVAQSSKMAALLTGGDTTSNSYIGINNWQTGGVTGNAGTTSTLTGFSIGKRLGTTSFESAMRFGEGFVLAGKNTDIGATDIGRLATYVSNRYAITVT